MHIEVKAFCGSCGHEHDLTDLEGVDIEGYVRDEVILKCESCDDDKCEFCPKEIHKDCDKEEDE